MKDKRFMEFISEEIQDLASTCDSLKKKISDADHCDFETMLARLRWSRKYLNGLGHMIDGTIRKIEEQKNRRQVSEGSFDRG